MEARHFYKVFMLFSVSVVIAEVTLLVIFQVELVNMYTSDPDVRKRAQDLIWIICITQFPETMKGPSKGLFKAIAMQYKAVYISLFSNYVINLFFMWFLAFHLDMK